MKRTSEWIDVKADPPINVGWYAVTACWDPEEGLFPMAGHWNGEKWSDHLPVVLRSPATFPDREDAETWARQNDIEETSH